LRLVARRIGKGRSYVLGKSRADQERSGKTKKEKVRRQKNQKPRKRRVVVMAPKKEDISWREGHRGTEETEGGTTCKRGENPKERIG